MLHTRPVAREDLEELHALLIAAEQSPMSLAERASWLEWVIAGELHAPPGTVGSAVFVATRDFQGPLLGMATLEPQAAHFAELPALRPSARESTRATVELVLGCVVAPAERRRGVGRGLGRIALAHAFERWKVARVLSCAPRALPGAGAWMRALGLWVEENPISPDGPLGLVGVIDAPRPLPPPPPGPPDF